MSARSSDAGRVAPAGAGRFVVAPGAVAPISRRVLAYAVDALLLVLAFVAGYVVGGARSFLPSALCLVVAVAQWLAESFTGASAGGALVGTRTVSVRTGRPAGLVAILVRQLVVGAGALACLVGQWVVVVSGVWDPSPAQRGWHDKLAGTLVLRAAAVRQATGGAPVADAAWDNAVARALGNPGGGRQGQGLPGPVAPVPISGAPGGPSVPGAPPAFGSRPVPGAPPGSGSRPVPGAPPAAGSRPVPGAPPAAGSRPVPGAPPAAGSRPVPGAPPVLGAPAAHATPPTSVQPPAPVGPLPRTDEPVRTAPMIDVPADVHPLPDAPVAPRAVIGAPPASPAVPASSSPPHAAAGLIQGPPSDVRSRRDLRLDERPSQDPRARPSTPGEVGDLGDLEHTRLRPGGPAPASAPDGLRLVFDTGERLEVAGDGLVGRRPTAEEGVDHVVAIDDPERSISKVHLAFGPVPDGGLWVMDRGSTNGTVLVGPDGSRVVLPAGARVGAPVGSTIRFGQRSVRVERR
ncbi:RDD family protein [Cellulomonas sp. URHB0016]